jgi:hypothetical protein
LASFSVFGKCAKISQLYRVNISTMWDGILYQSRKRTNAIKSLACLTEKCVFSLCAKWVKSCPNPVNISTTRKKFKILSLYPRKDAISKKPSHATVPLKGPLGWLEWHEIDTIEETSAANIFCFGNCRDRILYSNGLAYLDYGLQVRCLISRKKTAPASRKTGSGLDFDYSISLCMCKLTPRKNSWISVISDLAGWAL